MLPDCAGHEPADPDPDLGPGYLRERVASDQVELYVSGTSGFQNLGDGYYQFKWKTLASWAKTCRDLRLDLAEGSATVVTLHEAPLQVHQVGPSMGRSPRSR